MNGWELAFLGLATTVWALSMGWIGASARFMELAGRVAEVEAALVHYWERARKRLGRPDYVPPPAAPDPYAELKQRGLLDVPTAKGQ